MKDEMLKIQLRSEISEKLRYTQIERYLDRLTNEYIEHSKVYLRIIDRCSKAVESWTWKK